MSSKKEKAKLFIDVFGEFLDKQGYVKKGNVLFQIDYKNQILKYVHFDVMAQGYAFRICFDALPFVFGVNPKKATSDVLYDQNRIVSWKTGNMSPLVNELYPTEDNMKIAVAEFIQHVFPLLQAVVGLESCYLFHSQIMENCFDGKIGFIFVLMCVAMKRYREAFAFAEHELNRDKKVFEANEKYYDDEMITKEKRILEETELHVNRLLLGDAEYYEKMIDDNVKSSFEACHNFFDYIIKQKAKAEQYGK